MNKARKQELLDVTSILCEASDRLNEIRDEEQEAFDNMPEGLQMSVRGEKMIDAIDQIDSWEHHIHKVIDMIEKYATSK